MIFDSVLDKIETTPSNISVKMGKSQKYSATAFYENGHHADITMQAIWASTEPTVMSVLTSSGFAQEISVGPAEITAEFSSKTSNTGAVTVTAP